MENQNSSQNYNCVSEAIPKPFTFRWRIEQFPARLLKIGDRFASSKFEVGDGVPMYVEVKRIKAGNGNEEGLAMYLCNVSEKSVKLDFSITLVNSQSGESLSGRVPVPRLFDKASRCWGIDVKPFCEIINKNRGFLTADNSLTVVVEGVAIIEEEKMGEIEVLQLDLTLKDEALDDFGKLFNDETLSDFVVKVKDAGSIGKEFKVHKQILAARSKFFAAMFSQAGVKESREGVLEVEDIDSGAMEALLRFLYSGKTHQPASEGEEKDGNKELELLIAADKYEVLGLKGKMERVLVTKLSTENVCECFVVAKRHSAPFLAVRCKEFIRSKAAEIDGVNFRWMASIVCARKC